MFYNILKNESKGMQMEKRFAIERRDKILRSITQKGRVTVDELIDEFKVSGATIRRDLEFLERQDLIQRAHGGAISRSRVVFEPDYSEQRERFLEEKKRIGREASKLVMEGEVIFLEASTTVLELAKHMKDRRNVTVVTNSLDIARELEGNEGIELILTGGVLKRRTRALIGPLAETSFKQIRVDKAFTGISALDISYGMTMATLEEAQTRREIHQAANKIIVLSDHSKFGKQQFAYIAPVNSIDTLVTDKGIPEETKREMEKMGIEIRIV